MNNIIAIIWHTIICWIRNKIYIGFVAASLVLLAFSFISSYLAGLFCDRIFIDSSMFFIEFISIITAIFMSSTSIIKDIQTKEVYYILSKPISKFQFIIGRFLGIAICVVFLNLIISGLFIIITYLNKYELSNITVFYFTFILSLKIIVICSFALIFSTYSTSFFPSIILTFMLLITFEFLESIQYWLTHAETHFIIKTFYKILFFLLPNFVYYDIFYIYDYTKLHSLFEYVFFLTGYTTVYVLAFLIIALISFNKRSL